MSELINYLISDKSSCRRAPATPGLLTIPEQYINLPFFLIRKYPGICERKLNLCYNIPNRQNKSLVCCVGQFYAISGVQ